MKQLFFIISFLFVAFCSQAQFRLAVNGVPSWTNLGGGLYSATVTFHADLTGNSYAVAGIVDTMRLFTSRGQVFEVDSVWGKTFSQATLRVEYVSGVNSAPVGQGMVYAPNANGFVPDLPFGSTGATAQFNQMPVTYNASLSVTNEPAGSTTEIQFNLSGAFGASSLLTYSTADSSLAVNGIKIWKGRWGKSANTAVGENTLTGVTTGTGNTAIGSNALRDNTIGVANTAVGYQALLANTLGSNNCAMGYRALYSTTDGGYNAAMGAQAMNANTSGGYNAAFGYHALYSNTTGNQNTALGYQAGRYITGSSENTSANNSVFVGAATKAANVNQTNQIVIGHGATGLGDSTAVLGAAMKKVRLGNNLTFKTDQSIGAGQDNYVLTYDHSAGTVSLEASASGADGNGIYSGDGTAPADVDVTVTDSINFDAGTLIIDGVNNRVGVGISSAVPAAQLSVRKDGIGVTQNNANGIVLANNRAATDGAQQMSPGLRFRGNGWKTNATAGSQTVDWLMDVLPVQGAANPTSRLQFKSSVNGAAYTTPVVIESSGNVGIGIVGPTSGLHVLSASAYVANFQSSASANMQVFFSSAANYNTNLTLRNGGIDKWYFGSQGVSDDRFYIANSGDTKRFTILQSGDVGVGMSKTSTPDRPFHVEASDAVTNAVTYAQRNSHITSGTATTGFGVGTEQELEDAAGNNEVAATQEVTWSDATNASEDATYLIKQMKAGTLDTTLLITSTGNVAIGGNNPTPARTLHVAGEARITDLTTDTPTRLVGADADGDLGAITVGSGLNLSGGTLTATGGVAEDSLVVGHVPYVSAANTIQTDPAGDADAMAYDNSLNILTVKRIKLKGGSGTTTQLLGRNTSDYNVNGITVGANLTLSSNILSAKDTVFISLIAAKPGVAVTQTAGHDYYDATFLVPEYLNGFDLARVDYAMTNSTATTGSWTVGIRLMSTTNTNVTSNGCAATFNAGSVRASSSGGLTVSKNQWLYIETNTSTAGTLDGTNEGLLATLMFVK